MTHDALNFEVVSDSLSATQNYGERLAGVLAPGTVVLLVGGLGAGKTAFAQGMARGLGVREPVTSPTFTLVSTYDTDGTRGVHRFLHADLYRVGSGEEAEDLAIGELVEDGALAAVEWGDLAPGIFGSRTLEVRIVDGDREGQRVLRFSSDEIDLVALRHHLEGQ